MKQPKQKHVKLSTLKKKVWTLCSLYIRQRDADENGFVSCVTCGTSKHWKQVDAGHCFSRKDNAILFDERNIHAQCKNCNGRRKGLAAIHATVIAKRYGTDVLVELNELRQSTKQFTIPELYAIMELFKQKLEDLPKQKANQAF